MAHVSHKLKTSFEGALAGGGDPATSPLYVFGPFLRLIVIAGIAAVTFGTTIWLVVFTIAMVSAMYRLVMTWVTDGSGGSGLSEEEFGGWAVKVNAAITFIEYTLTFLVSMAAMVTFIADRFPLLNESVFGIQYRTIVAICLSILTGWLVNRGPRTAARAFGPATAGVLLLLWAMIISTILNFGLQLPDFSLQAFTGEYLHFTFAGFTRMLAVMTGIEVFANLVAAYDGPPKEKSNKAFGSLLIIMGTTAVTMIIVGPAIFRISDPTNHEVSVFTQTMDALLPHPLAYLGTLIGIAVLLSASAASAQGLQNLALGLKERNYLPAFLGQRNKFDVADKPVWLQVGLVTFVFLIAGTNEETYLALYAAGVFVLLSMTGWAASKRLLRELGEQFKSSHFLTLIGTIIAALITTAATVVIFEERFLEGAWAYFILIPLLYFAFSYFRSRLGMPSPISERLGELEGAMQAGFGFGQAFEAEAVTSAGNVPIPIHLNPQQAANPAPEDRWQDRVTRPTHILVPLDGSCQGEEALPAAEALCSAYSASLTLLTVKQDKTFTKTLKNALTRECEPAADSEEYLQDIAEQFMAQGINTKYFIRDGDVSENVNQLIKEVGADLVVISTQVRSGLDRLFSSNIANDIIQAITCPVLVMRPTEGEPVKIPDFNKLLVTLDGSNFSERVLPYVKASTVFESNVLLLSVPQVPEADRFGAVVEEIQELRDKTENAAKEYLNNIAGILLKDGVHTQVIVQGSRPAKTIARIAEEENVDVIFMATHGRGGLDRLFMGSVAERTLNNTSRPIFIVPINELRQPPKDNRIE
jgi:nucleotide-binding universal stress UspA family protein